MDLVIAETSVSSLYNDDLIAFTIQFSRYYVMSNVIFKHALTDFRHSRVVWTVPRPNETPCCMYSVSIGIYRDTTAVGGGLVIQTKDVVISMVYISMIQAVKSRDAPIV